MIERKRIVIAGAGGRDFHCFNTVYRDDPSAEVLAFSAAAQIPHLDQRTYPAELAGPLYPNGIPVVPESELAALCRRERVDQTVFAYSDVSHQDVMHLASQVIAAGSDFVLMGPRATMLAAGIPVIAVSAVRTGCGKSQTARWITQQVARRGLRAVAVRHPMVYGDIQSARVQRFATQGDLAAAQCTAEEHEEYEPYLESGAVVYAGVDYREILQRAEKEADLLIWDGGNNDFPFVRPDLHIVLIDALRPDDIDTYHPGEAVARMADVLILNKVSAALPTSLERAEAVARRVNPDAVFLQADSPVRLDDASVVRGKRVLVVEDGPTLTHGGMRYGAGYVAAIAAGAKEIIDPRPSAAPEIADVFRRHPHLTRVLPAMGYDEDQLEALRQTIVNSSAEVVVTGSPVDLAKLLRIRRPVVRARYAYEDRDDPGLQGVVEDFLRRHGLGASNAP